MSQLLDQMRDRIRTLHYSIRTEDSYVLWAKQFILFHRKRHPLEMGEAEVGEFLTYLAAERNVAASTQNQALSAILFLYKVVLDRPLERVEDVLRAKKPQRLPVVFTREEVQAVLARMQGDKAVLASLLYGSALRLMECLRLRGAETGTQLESRTSCVPVSSRPCMHPSAVAAIALRPSGACQRYKRFASHRAPGGVGGCRFCLSAQPLATGGFGRVY